MPFLYFCMRFIILATSRRGADIVVRSSVRTYIRRFSCGTPAIIIMYVCNMHFDCLHDNSRNTGAISSISLWTLDTLETLGQHEFAFGFCGSTRSIAAAIPALRALFVILGDRKLKPVRVASSVLYSQSPHNHVIYF